MGTLRRLTLVFWTVVIAAPAQTLAQQLPTEVIEAPTPSSDDVITLHDGTILRGRVAESVPGQFTRMVLADGQTREIQASAIASSQGPSFAVAPANPATEADDAMLHEAPGRVVLRVETPHTPSTIGRALEGMTISVRGHSQQVYRRLCDTPCTLHLLPEPVTLFSHATASGTFALAWSGTVPPNGGTLQLWSPEDLAKQPDSLNPDMLRMQTTIRQNARAMRAWSDQLHRRVQTRSWLGRAGLMTYVVGLGQGIGGVFLATFSNGDCSRGLNSGSCAPVVAGASIATVGFLAAVLGMGFWLTHVPGMGGGGSYAEPQTTPVPDPVPILLPDASPAVGS